MSFELLAPAEMGEADRLAIEAGPLDGYGLMCRAGAAVAAEILRRYPAAPRIHVLCGPGNNGGDGYVVARLLRQTGVDVAVWALGNPRDGSDAARAAKDCQIAPGKLSVLSLLGDELIVDALFGAGLSKPLDGDAAKAIAKVSDAGCKVVAIDLPSGVSGDSGAVLGSAFRADLTVTFFRKKPGHLLHAGRARCGETIVADIGISSRVLDTIRPATFENGPALWSQVFPSPSGEAHKYSRGHVGVFSGGPSSTGAARLSAMAAQRAGAGAVTVLSEPASVAVNAAHLTSIILRNVEGLDEVRAFLEERKPGALVFGPGLGTRPKVADFALELLDAARGRVGTIVFDADALTVFASCRDELAKAARQPDAPKIVLTPHEGEFKRLFPDIAADAGLSKLSGARQAAELIGGVVIYKGPDTVIAAPDGRAAINSNGVPWLATAGSGDVLAGIVAGLAAQGMPVFEAAAAGVWIHAEAAGRFGPGLIAEDLPAATIPVVRDILAKQSALRSGA
ncbi:MAG TPA: NAD(P)H-hydrate dehydratase [Rhizobiaceae bacterium]|nr:NAD(P)H-hydrate dehydratase [Rhizobiaceae bacterium]